MNTHQDTGFGLDPDVERRLDELRLRHAIGELTDEQLAEAWLDTLAAAAVDED